MYVRSYCRYIDFLLILRTYVRRINKLTDEISITIPTYVIKYVRISHFKFYDTCLCDYTQCNVRPRMRHLGQMPSPNRVMIFMMLWYIVILKCQKSQYRREIFGFIISAAQWYRHDRDYHIWYTS